MTDREIQKRIEQHIRGELSSEEEDELWVEFLVDPSWYDFFNTWLHIAAIGMERLEKKVYS